MEARTIDKIPAHKTPVYHASRGDQDRYFQIDLCDGNETLTLTGTESVRVRYKRPDGYISSFAVDNYGGTSLTARLPSDATQVPGMVYCKLRVKNIGFKAFYFEIEGL